MESNDDEQYTPVNPLKRGVEGVWQAVVILPYLMGRFCDLALVLVIPVAGIIVVLAACKILFGWP